MNTTPSVSGAAGRSLLLVVSLACSTSVWAQPLAVVQDGPGGPEYLEAQMLVQFRAEATDAQLADAVGRGQLGLLRQIETPGMRAAGRPGVSHMWTRLPVRQAIQALQNHPAVAYAEPNWVYRHQEASNDPYFTAGSLWGMYGNLGSPANAFGSQAAEAWAAGYVGSTDVVVGIIDEGVQVNHPDLYRNIWVNSGEIPGNTQDDDGNGYVDDIHGWDFYENNSSVYDSSGDDHGTHVAGTVGAEGGNGVGVVGVNWHVTMISGKFLGPQGGSTADAIEAVNYFTDLKKNRGVPVVALNNSWGGGGYSQGLHDAIIRAAKQGILFVAAAGNGNFAGRAINLDSSPYYPACYDTSVGTSTEPAADYDAVIAVTAIDSSGNKASWANYGATRVDLGAPGVGINSTLPGGYGAYSGTSMATPHVTGAIALYAAAHPDATAAQIRSAILGSTAPTSSMSGRTVTGGRLDLSTVIGTTPPDPGSGVMHCGDLDGFGSTSGNNWKATVTVTVHDANEDPVAGASVNGQWSGGTSGTASGVTDSTGKVVLVSGAIGKRGTSATFTVTGLSLLGWSYDAGSNHDPDGDSTGTAITVSKP